MDLKLTEEQEAMRKLAHDFAENEMRPIAAECDEKEDFPMELFPKAAKVGLTSYYLPKEYGGGGVTDPFVSCLVGEELGWGCAGITTSLTSFFLAFLPILDMGTDQQKRKHLTPFTDPDKTLLAATALTEPGAGSDTSLLSTAARREGDHYVLNGTKCFITNGGIADLHVIFARMAGSKGLEGITAFIVEGKPRGLSMGKKERKMGMRASHTAEVILEDVKVPVEERLGQEGGGLLGAMRMLDHSRPYVGSVALGIARAALEVAVKYSMERVQFGGPISRQQAIAFKLADMAMAVDAARLLIWRAAWLQGLGLPMSREGSMAKCFASDVAMRVTTEAVQVHGGYGYMKDYPLEKWMRDAKLMQIVEGTNEIQRVVISRDMFSSMKRSGVI